MWTRNSNWTTRESDFPQLYLELDNVPDKKYAASGQVI
jgi:hypothetical protein